MADTKKSDVGSQKSGAGSAEVKTEKVVKNLDDVKDSPENKTAIAKDAGKVVEEKKDKVESKPAVEKAQTRNSVPSSKGTKVPSSSGKKEKKGAEKVELEREYVVPLKRGVLNVPRYRRAKKAIRVLKEFMVRHMKVRDRDLRKVKIDINLNNEIWFRGIKKPMNKIRVKAKKIDGIVYVELAEIPEYVGYKIAREARKRAESEAAKVKAPKKIKEEEKTEEEKVEEKEDVKAGAEMDAKAEKKMAKDTQHTAEGKHMKKTMPVRKSLKK